ncbi:hypothetical protein R1sor_022774 [Riccia sorocarpa]|uniref:Uncharacterized protein n=1 Tax=Riccia sorocarpa TaxID=122646 RepID=A0ABD3GKW3_9MARC
MASKMRSTFAKGLVAVIAISSMGIAMAHSGHAHAPAPALLGESAAVGLVPAAIGTGVIVAVSGFFVDNAFLGYHPRNAGGGLKNGGGWNLM